MAVSTLSLPYAWLCETPQGRLYEDAKEKLGFLTEQWADGRWMCRRCKHSIDEHEDHIVIPVFAARDISSLRRLLDGFCRITKSPPRTGPIHSHQPAFPCVKLPFIRRPEVESAVATSLKHQEGFFAGIMRTSAVALLGSMGVGKTYFLVNIASCLDVSHTSGPWVAGFSLRQGVRISESVDHWMRGWHWAVFLLIMGFYLGIFDITAPLSYPDFFTVLRSYTLETVLAMLEGDFCADATSPVVLILAIDDIDYDPDFFRDVGGAILSSVAPYRWEHKNSLLRILPVGAGVLSEFRMVENADLSSAYDSINVHLERLHVGSLNDLLGSELESHCKPGTDRALYSCCMENLKLCHMGIPRIASLFVEAARAKPRDSADTMLEWFSLLLTKAEQAYNNLYVSRNVEIIDCLGGEDGAAMSVLLSLQKRKVKIDTVLARNGTSVKDALGNGALYLHCCGPPSRFEISEPEYVIALPLVPIRVILFSLPTVLQPTLARELLNPFRALGCAAFERLGFAVFLLGINLEIFLGRPSATLRQLLPGALGLPELLDRQIPLPSRPLAVFHVARSGKQISSIVNYSLDAVQVEGDYVYDGTPRDASCGGAFLSPHGQDCSGPDAVVVLPPTSTVPITGSKRPAGVALSSSGSSSNPPSPLLFSIQFKCEQSDTQSLEDMQQSHGPDADADPDQKIPITLTQLQREYRARKTVTDWASVPEEQHVFVLVTSKLFDDFATWKDVLEGKGAPASELGLEPQSDSKTKGRELDITQWPQHAVVVSNDLSPIWQPQHLARTRQPGQSFNPFEAY